MYRESPRQLILSVDPAQVTDLADRPRHLVGDAGGPLKQVVPKARRVEVFPSLVIPQHPANIVRVDIRVRGVIGSHCAAQEVSGAVCPGHTIRSISRSSGKQYIHDVVVDPSDA
jgi:hypothetical protein